MNPLRAAIANGLRDARRFRLLLPLYLAGLLLGLFQAWPLLVAGVRGGLSNPFVNDLAAGGADALVNLFLGNPTAGAGAGIWALLLLPVTALFSLAYNFFSGGILSAWAGTRPFWAGCRRTFWSFTGLGLLLIVLALLCITLAALLGSLVGGQVTLIIAALLIQLLNLAGEYARALAVARDRLDPIALFRAGLRFSVRPGALALGALGLLLHVGLAALFGAIQGAVGGGLLAVLIQQLAVLAWLWIKLLRLAWALGYVRAADSRQALGMESAAVGI